MSQARDLLSVLLSTTDQAPAIPDLPPASLTSTTISKPVEIPSVQAFNAQLIIGGKDEALRKAARAFEAAADSMERVQIRGEKYWSDALKTRNANWRLVPAPPPAGTPTGKGTDKTTRDFWITFGLAECTLPQQLLKCRFFSYSDLPQSTYCFQTESSSLFGRTRI
jgi:mediator of RNA polymerase II transcription subunit 17